MANILFIAAQEQPVSGGSELLWSRVARELSAQGHTAGISLPNGGRFDAPETLNLLIRARLAPRGGLGQRVFNRLRVKIDDPRATHFETMVRELRPDLIVINQPGCSEGVYWAELAGSAGVNYVLLVHNIHRGEWMHPEYATRVAAAYRGALRVDLLSDDAEMCLEDIVGEAFANTARFQNPFLVDFGAQNPFPEESDGYRVAFVGRADPRQKGLDLLIRAITGAVWRDRNIRFHIYGDGLHREFLESMAKRLSVVEQVRFEGSTADISQVWRENHLLFMPSRFEGLPIAMIEAMLCSRAALITAVGGVPEWIEDAQNGLLIPAATLPLVREGLERAWSLRASWKTMGQAARETAEARVSPDPTAVYACELLNLLPQA